MWYFRSHKRSDSLTVGFHHAMASLSSLTSISSLSAVETYGSLRDEIADVEHSQVNLEESTSQRRWEDYHRNVCARLPTHLYISKGLHNGIRKSWRSHERYARKRGRMWRQGCKTLRSSGHRGLQSERRHSRNPCGPWLHVANSFSFRLSVLLFFLINKIW